MCEHESWDRSGCQKNGNLTSAEQSAFFCETHSERSEGCVHGGTQTVNKRIQRVFELVLGDISDKCRRCGREGGPHFCFFVVSHTAWKHRPLGIVAPLLSMINFKGSAFLII